MKSAHCFFINLFRNFGPQAYEPWKKWVEQWVTHRESRYQRVAIALWGAVLVCHNHWPANEAFKIQKWAVQILDSAIPHISANIKPFWEKMFELAANRDIRYYSEWEPILTRNTSFRYFQPLKPRPFVDPWSKSELPNLGNKFPNSDYI